MIPLTEENLKRIDYVKVKEFDNIFGIEYHDMVIVYLKPNWFGWRRKLKFKYKCTHNSGYMYHSNLFLHTISKLREKVLI